MHVEVIVLVLVSRQSQTSNLVSDWL